MNTEHLAFILEIYKCGSVNQAAKNCYISQSHLSSIIKSVENEIGFQIFLRTKSGLTITPAGEKFIVSAEHIINEERLIKTIPFSLPDSNDLSIIMPRAAFMAKCFFKFLHQYPSKTSHDSVLSAGVVENIKGIISQQATLGFLILFKGRVKNYSQVAEQYSLDFSVLKDHVPVYAFFSKKHPLANRQKITKADLSDYSIVVDAHIEPDDTLNVLDIKDRSKVLFVTDRGMSYDAVKSGLYYSIGIRVPSETAKDISCQCSRIIDAEPMSICMVKARNHIINKRESHFIDFLTEEISEFMK